MAIAKDGLTHSIINEPELRTVQDAYTRAFRKFPEGNCFATRKRLDDGKLGAFEYKTFREVEEIATKLGSGLINLNIVPEHEKKEVGETEMVVIWAKNREEWLTTDIACTLYRLCLVPVYDTLGPQTAKFILDQTKARTMIVSKEHIDNVIEQAANSSTLMQVIALDTILPEQEEAAKKIGLKLFSYESVIAAGEKKREFRKVDPEDYFTINYTSGTTGVPKGVILTHKNQLSAASSPCNRKDIELGTSDTYISYLPLAHAMERCIVLFVALFGGCIGFYNGDVLKIKDDLQDFKPTLFVSVPRLYNRFYDKMQDGIDKLTGVKKSLANTAISTKMDNLTQHQTVTHALYDSLVFKKMKEAMGGRIKYMVTGSAPIELKIENFLRVAIGVPMIDGYGQTETCAGSFLSRADVPSFGHVGGPLSCLEMKVIDVPEMDYLSRDTDENGHLAPRGEICLRGNSVFKGYYKDEEKTKEALDKDGWVHTGDIGRINADGSLSIIDRKKNIFKLSQGEYVAPEKVENVYVTSKYVEEIFVYGDSYRSHCIAFAVPNKEALAALAKDANITGTHEELCKNPEIVSKVLADMNKKGKESKINSFELAKQLILEPVSFGVNNLLTPTFKVMRHQAKNFYQKEIDTLYATPLEVAKK